MSTKAINKHVNPLFFILLLIPTLCFFIGFMSLFSFDEQGHLMPYSRISINSLDFLEEFFVNQFEKSRTRSKIYTGFIAYVHDLGHLWQQDWTIWIDGSFTTAKNNPRDIDIVSFVNWSEQLQAKNQQTFSQFAQEFARQKYFVDANFCAIYPQNDLRYSTNQDNFQYWSQAFGFAHLNDIPQFDQPKGIIQIDIIGLT